MKDQRIGLLMGGHNSEHEVSMRTGAALAGALRARGYTVAEIDVDDNLPRVLLEKRIQVAFIGLHGRWFEDGCVQGLLESLRIPYTGSGVLASALSMDKVFAKRMFRERGLPVIPEQLVARDRLEGFSERDLSIPFPVMVKPSREGSSVGVSLVKTAADLPAALREAARWAGEILVERYVKGREIQIGVLDDPEGRPQAIGAIEVVPTEEFYNYKAKYAPNSGTRYLFPAPLTEEQNQQALRLGLEAHVALGCSGVSRVDLILDDKGGWVVLEVNTLPGMTEASLIPKIAQGVGISFEDLVERLLLGARLRA